MTPELVPSALPALPVRRRETLEILDTALKLYRRYFWILIGWSVLVSSVALVPGLSLLSLFTMPLLQGAVSCCVAAAVRGQNVKFSQCWAFSKPRYGALLGSMLLSYLILFVVSIAIFTVSVLLWLLGVWAISSAPQPVQVVAGIIGFVLGLVAVSVVGIVAFGWANMVPIVVCLEDDKRSTAAISRAFDLLKGNWRRVFSLALILGLAAIAIFVVVGAVYAIFGFGIASGIGTSQDSWLGLLGTFGAFMGLFSLAWYPAQTLIIAVLYLDLRVRREALDLEWTAYASAPVSGLNPDSAPPVIMDSGAVERVEMPFSNANVAPASFAAGTTPAPRESEIQLPPEGENEARRD